MAMPRINTWIFRASLSALDELSLFRTAEARDRGIASLAESFHGWGTVRFIGVNVAAIVVTMFVIREVMSGWTRASWVGDAALILAIGVMLMTTRWQHRRAAAKHLRQCLLESGVPVCVKCGYALRGLAPETAACPECGCIITAAAGTLLRIESDVRAGMAAEQRGVNGP